MRIAALAAGVVLLAAACSSGGGDSTATPASPTDTPTDAPPTAAPTPPGMTANEYWFRGIVTESEDGSPWDGPFIVTVEVTEPLGPTQLAPGSSFQVLVNYGFTPQPCLGEGTEGAPVGAEFIVYAYEDEDIPGYLAICKDGRYYMRSEAR